MMAFVSQIFSQPSVFVVDFVVQGIGLVSALRSVSTQNPVSAILWLILVFFSFSCVIICSGAEFIGLVFLVVYVGAIAVLFLFVVMMLNVRVTETNSEFLTYFPISGLFVYLFAIATSSAILPVFSPFATSAHADWVSAARPTNIQAIGELLYTYYFPLFLVSGAILFVAMVGSITLTLQRREGLKRQSVGKQLSHHFDSQLSLRK